MDRYNSRVFGGFFFLKGEDQGEQEAELDQGAGQQDGHGDARADALEQLADQPGEEHPADAAADQDPADQGPGQAQALLCESHGSSEDGGDRKAQHDRTSPESQGGIRPEQQDGKGDQAAGQVGQQNGLRAEAGGDTDAEQPSDREGAPERRGQVGRAGLAGQVEAGGKRVDPVSIADLQPDVDHKEKDDQEEQSIDRSPGGCFGRFLANLRAGQEPEPGRHRQGQQGEEPVGPADVVRGQDHPGEDQRGQEGTRPEEEMQAVHERPDFFPVDPGQQGVATHVQGALDDPQQEEDRHQEPEGVQHRHQGGAQGSHQQGQGLDAVPREAVIGPAAELGAEHIPQRSGNEDDADLVETAGGVLGQPRQRRSAN